MRNQGIIFGLVLVFFSVSVCFAQTLEKKYKRPVEIENQVRLTKSPTVAFWRSAIIPGLGQHYVGQKKKSYLIGSAELLLIAATAYEYERTSHYSDLVDHYLAELNAAPGNISVQNSYKSVYNKYNQHFERRNTLVWTNAIFWFLNAVDAYVQAHLFEFDRPLDFESKISLSEHQPDVICCLVIQF